MENILKSATLKGLEPGAADMALINQQTLRPLTAAEVFTFRLAACDNQVDRDYEQFTDAALEELAKMYVGRPVLRDHSWSSGTQTARVYQADVETEGDVKRLVLRCYMPRIQENSGTIAAILSGILRECSVGCAMAHAYCNICGADQTVTCCDHVPGRQYDGNMCVMSLDDPKDAYEVSMVAVPAQPKAGVVKSKRYGGTEAPLQSVPVPEPELPPAALTLMEQLAKMFQQNHD